MANNHTVSERDSFDMIYGEITGLGRGTKPTTVRQALPIAGNVTDYTIETLRHDDRAVLFLVATDAGGSTRLVIPDKVIKAIVRQHTKLFDRSTSSSRKRKRRTATLTAARKADHKAGKHDGAKREAEGLPRHMRGCPLCTSLKEAGA